MAEIALSNVNVLDVMSRALTEFGVRVHEATADAERVLSDLLAMTEAEVTSRQRAAKSAEQALAQCQRAVPTPPARPPDCSGFRAALVAAQASLDSARQARSAAERAVAVHSGARAALTREIDALVGRGRAILDHHRTRLVDYLAAAAAAGSASWHTADAPRAGFADISGSGHLRDATPPAMLPDGMLLVPLSDIDDSDSTVNSHGDFKKGYHADDLAWSFTALHQVVLPALARGQGLEYFVALDSQQGRSGTRSYAMCYSGFLGPDDRIVVRRDGSGYRVANGFHRIWLARRLGLGSVPAYSEQIGEGE